MISFMRVKPSLPGSVLLTTLQALASFVVIAWMQEQMAEQATEDVWNFVSTQVAGFSHTHDAKWKTVLLALGFSNALSKET